MQKHIDSDLSDVSWGELKNDEHPFEDSDKTFQKKIITFIIFMPDQFTTSFFSLF